MQCLIKDKCQTVFDILGKVYGPQATELKYETHFQLLIAVILSAQCTDKRVNIVTRTLFKKFPDVVSLSELSISELENEIKTCGLFKTKAKNIHKTCHMIIDEFNGYIPDTFEQLQTLPGVGRKTANVVVTELFDGDRIAVDTHVHRLANRIGFCKTTNPEKTEEHLMNIVPQGERRDAHHYLIRHGRDICKARKPLCGECLISFHCRYFKEARPL